MVKLLYLLAEISILITSVFDKQRRLVVQSKALLYTYSTCVTGASSMFHTVFYVGAALQLLLKVSVLYGTPDSHIFKAIIRLYTIYIDQRF